MANYKVSVNIDIEFEVEADDEDEATWVASIECKDYFDQSDVEVYAIECLDEEVVEEVMEHGHYPIEEIGEFQAIQLSQRNYPYGFYYYNGNEISAVKYTPTCWQMESFDCVERAKLWLLMGCKDVGN